MAGLSKLAPALRSGLILNLRPQQLQLMAQRESHARLFRRRPGQLATNRYKDAIHFYVIGVGALPCFLVLAISHIIYGPTGELTEYPENGHPHHWEFERTPLRQWYSKWFEVADVERHERNMALAERNSILTRFRRMEQRVKHLESQRWDLKGFYYEPVSAHWVEYARTMSERYRNKYEAHGHYSY